MSYQLQKGQNISLTRLATSLDQVAVGLGWDAHTGAGQPINLDSSAFLVNDQGKVLSDAHFIFFNQLVSPDNAVKHMGNNTTGAGAGDDEVITVNLARVDPRVEKIVFTATIYDAAHNFGQVNNAFIRIVDTATRQEILRYDLTDRFTDETAMVFGELYRYKGEWKFRAIGQGFSGGLQAMAETYGVDTNDSGENDTGPTLVASSTPSPTQQSVLSSEAARMPGKTSQLMTGISGVKYELLYPGAYTLAKIYLRPNEEVKAESDAMVAMDSSIDLESKMEGGILGGLSRKFLTGESFFFQKMVARRGEGWVLLGQAGLGDIKAIDLDGSTNYIVQKDGFLAATEGVEIGTTMQNLVQGVASGEGFFVINISGRGTLFVSSYGAIHEITVPPGQDYIVDNHHLVAWASTTHYSIERGSNGWISSFTSGEMLVCRFRGPGKVLIQTRNPANFAEWLKQFLPPPSADQKAKSQSPIGSLIDTAGKFM